MTRNQVIVNLNARIQAWKCGADAYRREAQEILDTAGQNATAEERKRSQELRQRAIDHYAAVTSLELTRSDIEGLDRHA